MSYRRKMPFEMVGARIRTDIFGSQPRIEGIHNRRKRENMRAFKVAIVTAVIVIAFSFSMLSFSLKSSAFTARAPILIEGNSNFTGANGVTGGSGIPSDPYMISGWEIDVSIQNGIEIRNTTDVFKIQGVYVHSGTSNSNDCIHFSNVTNGYIDNSDLAYYANRAIYIEDSSFGGVVDSRIIGPPSGFFLGYGIYLYDSTNFTVSNNLFYRVANSVQLLSSNDNQIIGNNFTTVGTGVYVQMSNNVTANGNDGTNISQYGVASFGATNITISNNNLTINDYVGIGIYLSSRYVTVEGNNISDNDIGIYTQISRDLNISNNIVTQSEDFGIQIDRTTNVTLSGNTLSSCGISLFGSTLSQFDSHTIPLDNQVNGKPVYYHKNIAGLDIDGTQMGGLIMVNCTGSQVANLQIVDTDIALELAYANDTIISGCNLSSNNRVSISSWSSNNLNITGNNLSGNIYGILLNSLAATNNITVFDNTVLSNSLDGVILNRVNQANIMSNMLSLNGQYAMWLQLCSWGNITDNEIINNSRGVYLDDCRNYKVYYNNFINNTPQGMERLSANAWDDGYPNGGNYWSDYSGVDLNWGAAQNIPGSDGIGDTSHDFGGFTDDGYPLMQPIPEFGEMIIPVLTLAMILLISRRAFRTRKN